MYEDTLQKASRGERDPKWNRADVSWTQLPEAERNLMIGEAMKHCCIKFPTQYNAYTWPLGIERRDWRIRNTWQVHHKQKPKAALSATTLVAPRQISYGEIASSAPATPLRYDPVRDI